MTIQSLSAAFTPAHVHCDPTHWKQRTRHSHYMRASVSGRVVVWTAHNANLRPWFTTSYVSLGGHEVDENILPGSLPHKFILFATLIIILLVANNFFSLSSTFKSKYLCQNSQTREARVTANMTPGSAGGVYMIINLRRIWSCPTITPSPNCLFLWRNRDPPNAGFLGPTQVHSTNSNRSENVARKL